MLKNLAIIGLSAAIIVAAVAAWRVFDDKRRIAENEATRAAAEESTEAMSYEREKKESERILNEMRLADTKRKNLDSEKEIALQNRLAKEAEADIKQASAAEAKDTARKAEAQLQTTIEARKIESEKAKTAKLEADKKANELEIIERQAAKALAEQKKAEAEALLINNKLEELEKLEQLKVETILRLEAKEAELNRLIEANQPEMTAKDLVTTEETLSDQIDDLNREEKVNFARGAAALLKAESELDESEKKRHDEVKAEILARMSKLLHESKENGEVIDAEFYDKIIKGEK